LGFTGKYVNLSRDLVSILRVIVPGDMSGLSAVVTGAVSSLTFVASLTIVSLVATSATSRTLVGATLVDVVQYYWFGAIGVMCEVRDPRDGTVSIVVGTVLTLVVVLGSSLMVVLGSLTVRSEF
jgi:hypothetical protein